MTSGFTGAVLAGGASRRMGRDKAFVDVRGRPLASIAADALRAAGASAVVAIGGDGDRLAALGLTPVADLHPGEGPLGGIVTALTVAATDIVAVLACDLPDVTADAVFAVVGALEDDVDAAAAVPVAGGHRQVLLAAYRRQALPPLAAAFRGGERSPSRALAPLRVVSVELRNERWARSADTPRDLGDT